MWTAAIEMNAWKPSYYRVVSGTTFVDEDGQRCRVAYSTRSAKTLAIPVDVAAALEGGVVPCGTSRLMERLVAAELLVPAGEDERATLTNRSRAAAASSAHRTVVLMPTAYCNMSCSYCGQEHHRDRGQARHRESIRRRVVSIIEDEGTRSARVRWFGGEPLLAYRSIIDLSDTFLTAAREQGKHYDALVVTNGSLLTLRRARELVHRANVRLIEVTIDGPAEVHDTHRPLRGGGRSYERIMSTLRSIVDDDQCSPLSIGLRTNIDSENAAYVSNYLNDIAARGFAHPKVRISLMPVHSWSNDVTAIELSKQRYAEQEAGWLRTMEKLGLRYNLLPTEPSGAICPATSRASEVISPDARVFTCTEEPLTVHDPWAAIATVDSLADRAELRPAGSWDGWPDHVEAGALPCSTCRFLGVCGGACPKLWREGIPPCPSYKEKSRTA
jgi:uncharacterized protein